MVGCMLQEHAIPWIARPGNYILVSMTSPRSLSYNIRNDSSVYNNTYNMLDIIFDKSKSGSERQERAAFPYSKSSSLLVLFFRCTLLKQATLVEIWRKRPRTLGRCRRPPSLALDWTLIALANHMNTHMDSRSREGDRLCGVGSLEMWLASAM